MTTPAYSILIDTGSDQVTIDANAKFELGYRSTPNNKGQIQEVLYSLVVDGEILVSDTDEAARRAAISARFIELAALVTDRVSAVPVQVLRDGAVEHDWEPSAGFSGPFVVAFNSTQSPGNGSSKWSYHLEVAFRSKPAGDQQDNAYQVVKTLSVAKDNGRVIRKVWTVSAISTSATSARTFVMQFKPAGDEYEEEVKLDYPACQASAVWVWEALQEVFCEVSYEGGGRGYVQDPLAGLDVGPNLFVARKKATTVTVRGYVRGFKEALIAPAKHFNESDTLRQVTEAKRYKVEIEDDKKGIYRLRFEEVWLSTAAGDPQPNHEKGHNLITLKASAEPPDGAIAS